MKYTDTDLMRIADIAVTQAAGEFLITVCVFAIVAVVGYVACNWRTE